jgi:hypothetical protein
MEPEQLSRHSDGLPARLAAGGRTSSSCPQNPDRLCDPHSFLASGDCDILVGDKAAGSVNFITLFHLMPRLRMCGTTSPLPHTAVYWEVEASGRILSQRDCAAVPTEPDSESTSVAPLGSAWTVRRRTAHCFTRSGNAGNLREMGEVPFSHSAGDTVTIISERLRYEFQILFTNNLQ